MCILREDIRPISHVTITMNSRQSPHRVSGLGSIAPKATLLGCEAIVQDVLSQERWRVT